MEHNHILLQSKVNYGNIITTVQVELYRTIQGLSFDVQCAAEIMSANAYTFAFYKIM